MRRVTRGLAACLIGLVTAGGLATAAIASPEMTMPVKTGTFTVGKQMIMLSQPADPGLGRLTPTKDAATRGMFGPEIPWHVIPIHAALSRAGHVISYGTPFDNGVTQGGFVFDNWNPKLGTDITGAHMDSDSMGYDSFCNSLVMLGDGRLLMVGGNSTMSTMVYDPVTGMSMMGKDLNKQRWYATTLRLPDGRVLVLGGSEFYDRRTLQGLPPGQATGTTPEIGTGTGAWRLLPDAANVAAFGQQDVKWFYPRAFNGPHGGVVGFSNNQVWALDVSGQGHVTLTGKLPFSTGSSGSQVMFAPGRVLVASGGSHAPQDHSVARSGAAIIDFNGKKVTVRQTGNVLFPGNWLNLTVLPTGKVFANGGTKVGTKAGADNADLTAEVWNPVTGKWTAAASAQRTRTYHSVALLMPSGAVFTGGGGAAPFTDGSTSGPENNTNVEMYYPAYLFTKGKDGVTRWASRPTITSISGNVTYGGTVQLGMKSAAKITSASLISLASVTHSQNTDQRRVPVSVKQRGKTVAVTLPKSVSTLPPGDYELTVTDAHGVPSPAQIITIRKGKPGLVTIAS